MVTADRRRGFLRLVAVKSHRLHLQLRICDNVHGAVEGDTCFAVAQEFNLTHAQFNAINPNINCNKVFIGQWLYIKGTA
ncbi:hypothetical protein ZIOFF_017853 [Zingiber officinale]|uniref:LysM domain-containing protein n=1 Tax=Zingiber officinale TaxID=94328 RepID=A0A8J5HFN6_ZINOF|nr:hypothetical protein ZIOFF_017853 [Zingiber officinale]